MDGEEVVRFFRGDVKSPAGDVSVGNVWWNAWGDGREEVGLNFFTPPDENWVALNNWVARRTDAGRCRAPNGLTGPAGVSGGAAIVEGRAGVVPSRWDALWPRQSPRCRMGFSANGDKMSDS